MKKLLLIFIMMATWMVVGCEAVRQAGCYGYWIESNDGHTDENDITNFGNVIFE
jgi:hypothetical protein